MRRKNIKKKLLLHDEPIETQEEDEFRHSVFVDVLFDLIREVETSCNIGLFGEWGAGKTSIIKMLFNRIRDDNVMVKTIKCFYFDSWKCSNDSWRTSFLIELDRELGKIIGKDTIIDALYNIREEEIGNKPVKFSTQLRNFLFDLRTFFIFIFVIIFVDIFLYIFTDIEIANIITASIIIPLMAELASKMNSLNASIRKRLILPKKEWAGEFEALFNKIITSSKAHRIVIAMDNLDRCENKALVEILAQLRAFMDVPKCIYIIPCDEEAILDHITIANREGGYFTENRQEFLRKIFQVMIRIPPFLPGNLEEYTQKLRQNLRTSFDENVQDIIVSAHAKNPRRIIHAFNRLTTLYLLAKKKEEMKIVRKGTITGNLPFLAKISIIEEEWKDFHKDLAQNNYLLDEIEDYFRNAQLEKDVASLIISHFERDPELMKFLNATRIVRVDDVKPFLLLNQEVYENAIHELEQFKVYVIRNEVNKVVDILSETPDNDKINYVKAILWWCNEALQCKRFSKGFNCLNVICHVYDLIPDELHTEVAKECGKYLDRKEIVQLLPSFDSGQLFRILPHIPLVMRDNVMCHLVDSFFNGECSDSLLMSKLMERSDLIGDVSRKRLNDTLIDILDSKQAEVAKDFIRTVMANEIVAGHLIEPRALSKMIESNRTRDNNGIDPQETSRSTSASVRKKKDSHLDQLRIRIRKLFGNLETETVMEISCDAHIEELIEEGAKKLDLDPQQIALIFGGQKLSSEITVREAGIEDDDLVGIIPDSLYNSEPS